MGRMKLIRNTYRILVRKTEGSILIGRPDSRWKIDIKMYLKGIECEGLDWIRLSQEGTSEGLL